MHKNRMILSVVLGSIIGVSSSLQAQEPANVTASEKMAIEISHEIMSPFCPGKLLSDCPSEKATDLKSQIAEAAQNGQTKEQILASLYSNFGKETLQSEPELNGFGLLAWIVPIAFLLIGAVGLILLFRQGRSQGA